MASKRYYLLINGAFVRTDNNQPIVEVQEDGRTFYATADSGADLEDYVEDYLSRKINEEKHNPLYNVIKETSLGKMYDHKFMLKNISTPLYRLQLDLIRRPEMSAKLDSEFNVGQEWDSQRYEFFTNEFIKFATLMDYVENRIRRSRKRDHSIYQVRSGEHRVMNVLYAPVTGVFNPYTGFPDLKGFEIFKNISDDSYLPEFEDFEKPFIFKEYMMRGELPVHFATSSDILKLCNINYKDQLSAGNIHRLLAGIVMRLNFSDLESRVITQAALQLPMNLTFYDVMEPDSDVIIDTFTNNLSALSAIQGTDNVLSVYDTTINFVKEAFPSLEDKRVTTELDIVKQVRSAEFV